MSKASLVALTLFASLNAALGGAPEPYAICVAAAPVTSNCTQDNVKGDWLVLYSSGIKNRFGTSYWGGDFPYDFCDSLNLDSGCMGVGYTLVGGDEKVQVGYAYAFNAFTNVWTIEKFENEVFTVPGSNLQGFRTTYTHYVQVEEEKVYVKGSPVACGSSILRSGPIYRSTNYVILANAPDFSWSVLLYCDNFYGFLDDNAPLIQVVVKKELIEKSSYPFNTLFFYNEIKTALIKSKLNVYAADFKLVYHDVQGLYPVSANWESIQWDSDCVCKSKEVVVKS